MEFLKDGAKVRGHGVVGENIVLNLRQEEIVVAEARALIAEATTEELQRQLREELARQAAALAPEHPHDFELMALAFAASFSEVHGRPPTLRDLMYGLMTYFGDMDAEEAFTRLRWVFMKLKEEEDDQ